MKIEYDEDSGVININGRLIKLDDPEAFQIISKMWLRAGWDTKYVYGFSWLGRPIIQLPEDLIRIQELIYILKPDIIIETGIAHGGSLIYYASLLSVIGSGRVIGIDIDIRDHNLKAIRDHKLSPLITLIEGSSIDPKTIDLVSKQILKNEKVMVILDSNHKKAHVLAELNAYSNFVSLGSYIIVCDGIMKDVAGAPRTSMDWKWDNPITAIEEFLQFSPKFKSVEPEHPFNEGKVSQRVTYWPKGYLKKVNN